jgi:hypothetical protein
MATFRPDFSTSAICATTSASAGFGAASAGAGSAVAPSLQLTSAGRISVEICAGGPIATDTASATSAGSCAVAGLVRTHVEQLRATVSMSDCSCASYCVWCVAWSPTMFTIGTRALRALCKLARPLPRPQPRWSNVAAGLPAMRA